MVGGFAQYVRWNTGEEIPDRTSRKSEKQLERVHEIFRAALHNAAANQLYLDYVAPHPPPQHGHGRIYRDDPPYDWSCQRAAPNRDGDSGFQRLVDATARFIHEQTRIISSAPVRRHPWVLDREDVFIARTKPRRLIT